MDIPFVLPAGLTLAAGGDLGGSSREAQARRRGVLCERGLTGPYVRLDQQHTRRVHCLGVSDAGDGVLVGDGAVTTADLTLTVTVADCMPIFLYDRRRGVKGLLHSGWKGTGILAAAVGRLQREFNSSPESIDVTLGPCIGSCCYRVDEHRAALFAGLWGTEAIVRRNEGPYLDLRAANEAILRNIGVVNVQVVTNCTACDPAFGSFRRQGPSAYTHMLAWV